ncbi:MAG: DUF4956 domain-containing protein [Aminipila sp.]
MINQFQKNIEHFISMISNNPNTMDVIQSLGMALILAMFMLGTYKLANIKESYRPKFGVTLVTLAFISTVLMDLIQSNLALSLGMLGSLSIVRFRTNIKDPRDIGFIFWSMAIGMAAATQSYLIGIVGSLVLAVVMVFSRNKSESANNMMMVIRGSSTNLDEIQSIVDNIKGGSFVKAKNVLADSFELVYEVELPEKESNNVIRNIFELGGIDSVNLLANNTQSI